MRRKEYSSEKITVAFDPGLCIHSEECVRGLPKVFDTSNRPWVQPDGSDPARVAEVVMRCPTGALRFERNDGGAQELVPQANVVVVGRNGPLYVRGDVEIKDPSGDVRFSETRLALCRCGKSKNKPFCDNTHVEANFRHDGSLGENRLAEGPASEGGRLLITPTASGSLLLKGEVETRDATGEAAYRGTRIALCRCGESNNKPFCDGSHAGTDWREGSWQEPEFWSKEK